MLPSGGSIQALARSTDTTYRASAVAFLHASTLSLQAPAPKPAQKPTGFQQTTTDETTNAIKVSLQDCLACSGCVTTAETMLLQHQSAEELLAKLHAPGVTVVATLSSQSRASLAAEYGMRVSEVQTCRADSTLAVHVRRTSADFTSPAWISISSDLQRLCMRACMRLVALQQGACASICRIEVPC